MEELLFQRPIPGSSLTDRPKNARWENPPDIADPDEALQLVIEGINKPEVLDNLSTIINIGFPLIALRDTLNTTNVMDGKYSLDVSSIIAEPILEQLRVIAEELDIDYVMGDEVTEADAKANEEDKIMALLKRQIKKDNKSKKVDEGTELLETIQASMESGTVEPSVDTMGDVDINAVSEQDNITIPEDNQNPRGLMSRREV
jgi:hypothetical protein